jgi:hypothetical protein
MTSSVSQTRQQGMALPTVMALSALCSVLLLAQWRSLALAEGLGRSADKRWQLQQHALTVLLTTADQLQGQSCAPKACQPLPGKRHTVSQWRGQWPDAYSVSQLDGVQAVSWAEVWPVPPSSPSAQPGWVYRLTALAINAQGQAVGWQAVWHPSAAHPPSLQQPMSLQGFKRLLALAP